MFDIDTILDGKEGSPRLSDLLKAAEDAYEKGEQRGIDSGVVSHLETHTGRDRPYQISCLLWKTTNVGRKRFGSMSLATPST